MISEQERIERMNWIGASDVPALFGMDQFKTLRQLYDSKKVLQEQKPGKVGSSVWYGNHLEAAIAAMAADKFSTKSFLPGGDNHPEWVKDERLRFRKGVMQVSLDGIMENPIIRGKGRGLTILECKSTLFSGPSPHEWGKGGTNEVPHSVLLQVQAQMEVSGINQAMVACLFGDGMRGFVTYPVDYDPEIGALIMDKATKFKERFLDTNTPPEGDVIA